MDTARYDNSATAGNGFYYTIPGLVANSTCTVTLFFVEGWWGQDGHGGGVGSRVFNVFVNNSATSQISNLDIYNTAQTLYGQGDNCAIAEQFTATAQSDGTLKLNFITVTNQAVVSGIMVAGSYTATSTANPLTLNGTGISGGGALINSSTTPAIYTGLITLGSASSIVTTSGNITFANAGTITGAGDALTLGGTAAGTINSIIGTGAGTLTANGGTWILGGINTYTGATTVSAGTLLVNGSIAAGSTVSVSSGATLGGGVGATAGTINGPVSDSGILSPGQSYGSTSTAILNTGAETFNAGGAFDVDLAGTTAGSGYDQLNVTGSAGRTRRHHAP